MTIGQDQSCRSRNDEHDPHRSALDQHEPWLGERPPRAEKRRQELVASVLDSLE